MIKLLLDANLSPETREYLIKTFLFDVIDLITENKSGLSDGEIILLAKKEKRIIITFDLDFGEIYHFKEKGKIGVIVLRLEDQTVESVNKTLYKFFSSYAKNVNMSKSLVVLKENKMRTDVGQ